MTFFGRLLDALFPPRPTEMLVRSLHEEQLSAKSAPAHLSFSSVEATALLPYHDPLVQAAIVEAKFHGNRKAQALLGAVLADYLSETVADMRALETANIVLVPIPLSRAREGARGYNQTERICTAALQQLGSGVRMDSHLIIRTRDTLPQTTLTRAARLENMRGAFGAAGAVDPAPYYLLIDDVATTGATLCAAAETLLAAGATRIGALALAH